MSLVAAAVAAAAAIGGAMYANAQNKKAAQKQQDFQASMSGSAHRREVDDLRAAGLNPLLSVTGGAGASTTQGASPNIENILAPALASATDVTRTKKDVDVAEAAILNQTNSTNSTIKLQEKQGVAADAAALQSVSTAKNAALNNQIIQTSMPAINKEAQLRVKQAEFNNEAQAFDSIVQRVKNTGDAAGSLLNFVPGLGKMPKSIMGTGRDGTKYHKGTGEILRP